jgi:hypothetical protein
MTLSDMKPRNERRERSLSHILSAGGPEVADNEAFGNACFYIYAGNARFIENINAGVPAP